MANKSKNGKICGFANLIHLTKKRWNNEKKGIQLFGIIWIH